MLILFGVLVLVFFFTHAVGDPARLMLPLDATYEQYMQLRHSLGLDRPILIQFVDFLSGAMRGDFGLSFWQGRPAMSVVLEWLVPTLQLSFCAMALALVIALPLGIISSFRPTSLLSRIVALISVFGMTVPAFWLGMMLILFFALRIPLFYTSGYGTVGHLVLPVVTLALLPAGRITQMVRSSMLQEIAQQYTITARAKGLAEQVIILRHVLKNAAIPVLTLVGFELGRMIAGNTIVVEMVFAWPGLGMLAVESISRRDLPLIGANVFVVASIVMLLTMITDSLYGYVDPRIRVS